MPLSMLLLGLMLSFNIETLLTIGVKIFIIHYGLINSSYWCIFLPVDDAMIKQHYYYVVTSRCPYFRTLAI